MNTYIAKIKHTFPSVIVSTFSCVIGLLLFRYLFSIFEINIKEDAWELWIPMSIPLIPLLFWVRPKFKILNSKSGKTDFRDFFVAVSALVIIGPSIVSQNLYSTLTGELEQVDNTHELESSSSRYFSYKKFDIETRFGGAFLSAKITGRYNDNYNMYVFIVHPMMEQGEILNSDNPKLWYGQKFHKRISNRKSDEAKELAFDTFYDECDKKSDQIDFNNFEYMEKLPLSDDQESFCRAIKARVKENYTDQYSIMLPYNEPFEERNGNKAWWVLGTFILGIFILAISLVFPKLDKTELKRQQTGFDLKDDFLLDCIKYLYPQGDHFITSIILSLNILLFLIMIFSGVHLIHPSGSDLLEWGGNRRSLVMDGEYYRLFTSMFIHSGFMHLLMNIFGLVLAAIFIEPFLGRIRFVIIYVTSGIAGGLASIWWHWEENPVGIGASGAIFGLFGTILILTLTNAVDSNSKKWLFRVFGFYAGISILMGFITGADNAAHIGGLVVGAVIGLIAYFTNPVQIDA